MPYFRNLNILFLHVPRTGGSSVENFFYYKNGVPPTIDNIHSFPGLGIDLNRHSLQHSTYSEIKEREKYFNIDFTKTKVISIVRNPYNRIMSDLIYFKMINFESSHEKVESTINNYLNSDFTYDNHKIPQYKFVIDSDNNICKDILILHTENLTEEMKMNGYGEFDMKDNSGNKENKNYLNLLNNNSIKKINEFYKNDFEMFNYEMLNDVSEIGNYNFTISKEIKKKDIVSEPKSEVFKQFTTKQEIQSIFDTPVKQSIHKNPTSTNDSSQKQSFVDIKDKKLEFEMLREKRIQELKAKQQQPSTIPPNIPHNSPFMYDKNKIKESFNQLRGKPVLGFSSADNVNII